MADTPNWPEPFAIRNCIAWNASAAAQAQRDSGNEFVIVPASATKRVTIDGKAMFVRLSGPEYREVRHADWLRHERNCESLYAVINEREAA